MQLSRCTKIDYGHIGCSSDVIELADARCSGRQACEIAIPDALFAKSQPCPEDLKPYLEVGYTCLSGKPASPLDPSTPTRASPWWNSVIHGQFAICSVWRALSLSTLMRPLKTYLFPTAMNTTQRRCGVCRDSVSVYTDALTNCLSLNVPHRRPITRLLMRWTLHFFDLRACSVSHSEMSTGPFCDPTWPAKFPTRSAKKTKKTHLVRLNPTTLWWREKLNIQNTVLTSSMLLI